MKKRDFIFWNLTLHSINSQILLRKKQTNYNYIIINTNCGFLKNCLFLQGTKML